MYECILLMGLMMQGNRDVIKSMNPYVPLPTLILVKDSPQMNVDSVDMPAHMKSDQLLDDSNVNSPDYIMDEHRKYTDEDREYILEQLQRILEEVFQRSEPQPT